VKISRLFHSYLASSLLVLGRFNPKKDEPRNQKVKNWVAGSAAGAGILGLGAAQMLSLLGFTAVAHSSGGMILTGAGGYIAGTYGIAILVSILMAPLTLLLFIACIAFGAYVLLKKKIEKHTGNDL